MEVEPSSFWMWNISLTTFGRAILHQHWQNIQRLIIQRCTVRRHSKTRTALVFIYLDLKVTTFAYLLRLLCQLHFAMRRDQFLTVEYAWWDHTSVIFNPLKTRRNFMDLSWALEAIEMQVSFGFPDIYSNAKRWYRLCRRKENPPSLVN